MLVPFKVEYPPPGTQERTPTPGAEMSGFMRLLPSRVTGPRLLNEAIPSLLLVAPTVNDSAYIAAGSSTVPHEEPLFPAEWTVTMPAARTFCTAGSRTSRLASVQPSLTVQPQELLITSGARSGRGLFPFRSVGATNHW